MPPFPLFDPEIDNQVTSPGDLGLKGDAAERRARDQRLARAAVRDKGQNKPDPEIPGVLANASPAKLANDLANGYLKHLETLGQLPMAPGVTFEDWNKGQQLRVKQDTGKADEAKSKEDQRLLDRARGAKAGREMSKGPQNLDVARAEQKLRDIPQGPRNNPNPRTISNSHWNDYHSAVTMTDDSSRRHLKFAEIPGKQWANAAPAAAHTEAFIKTNGDREKLDNYRETAAPGRPVQFTDTLTHAPGQDITLEQADQLYSGDRRNKSLAEWQRNRDAQSKPPMQAGIRASKGAKSVKGSGGASAEEGSGGESDMATGPSFQASRPAGVQSSVMQQQPQQGNHKSSVFGTLAGVGLGLGTGNWAPLATHILGSGMGGAVGAAAGGGGDQGQTSKPSQNGDSQQGNGSGSSDQQVQPQAQGAAGMETYIPLLAHLLGQKVATIMPQQQGGGFGGAPMPQQQSSGGWGESYGQQPPSPIQYPQGNQPPNPFGA